MESNSITDHGFTIFPGVFDAPEIDLLVPFVADLNSVGSRCLLDYEWCQGVAIDPLRKLV